MRFKYSYKVYEDCLAATEISESREKHKIFHSLTWGWIAIFSVIAFCAFIFGKSDISSRITGIIISVLAMAVSAYHFWYMITRYDMATEKKINSAITKYIFGNKRFIESDKKIDSLDISVEVTHKQCMGCGVVAPTYRCVAKKSGHRIVLPLCEECAHKLKRKTGV